MLGISRLSLALLALGFLPSCLLMGVGRPTPIDQDIAQETLNYYRAVESVNPEDASLGGMFFTLFPLVLEIESVSSMSTVAADKSKTKNGYVGADIGLYLFGLLYYRAETARFSTEGKLDAQQTNQRVLTGLLFRNWSSSMKNPKEGQAGRVEGWSVLWGFFGKETRDGKDDWTLFWL